jgi:hypothetical protein
MDRRVAIAFFVAISIVVSASAALAEVWVVWSQGWNSVAAERGMQWAVEEAYETQQACEAGRQRRIVELVRVFQDIARLVGGHSWRHDDVVHVIWKEGSHDVHMTLTYRCLPDTIDPREPRR